MKLEPLRTEDLDRLEPLWLGLHAHHRRVAPQLAPFVDDALSWASRKRQYAEVMAGNWFGFLARDGAADVGYLLCAERPMQWNATFDVPATLWELVTITLRDDHRGRGIGGRMLAAMEEHIQASGVQSRLIGVIPDNRAAVALYRARGYRSTWLMLTRFQRPLPVPPTVGGASIRSLPVDEVDRLKALWLALHHHHQAVSPELGPFVPDAVSWPVIRDLVAENAAHGLLFGAFDGDRLTGFASAAVYDVRTLPSYSDTWRTGERVGEIKFLSVAPAERGRGIGAALTQAVDRALAARGVEDVFVGAIAPNAGAIRFYEARGFRPAWLELTQF
ncbi:GNAT family N-acetyltransferase [Dongia sp.]|uniref:GNAT family N-acetyltransferase n=1 Tax=Dongia sp. TaxID=1977262 RepID=UPI003753B046